jgi:hypothetical protein
MLPVPHSRRSTDEKEVPLMASVRVPVAFMAAKVEEAKSAYIAEAVAKNLAARAAFAADLKEYKTSGVAALKAAMVLVRKGETVTSKRHYDGEVVLGRAPQKPALLAADDVETRFYDRDLAILAATSQETISVSTGSDWARYL